MKKNKLDQINFIYEGTAKRAEIVFKAKNAEEGGASGDLPEIKIPTSTEELVMVCCYTTEEQKIYRGEDAYKQLDVLSGEGTITVDNIKEEVPTAVYSDVTDANLLGSEEISQENLSSKEHGLWAFSGKRTIKIKLGNIKELTEDAVINYVKIKFDRVNDENYIYNENGFTINKVFDENSAVNEFEINIDTDILGKVFEGKYSELIAVQVKGKIEVNFEAIYKDSTGMSYPAPGLIYLYFPISITLRNTAPSICDKLSSSYASIDFGTSSTCVAIENEDRFELLTISSSDGGEDNRYENPTNFMMFNWERLYSEWKTEHISAPVFTKGTTNDFNGKKEVDCDFGYSVKELLRDVNKDELNAILTLIKMVPYQILQEGKQLNINPLKNKDKYVYIVTEPEQQDESHLDPIAFYGYLIGRAINDVSKNRHIFNKFLLTSPVKFNNDIKKKISHSIEYGLSRAIPIPLRDSIKVEMKYAEPVAYIGAMCGTEHFMIDEEETKMFAVYDFGGGTLDFSYGTVSNIDDELIVDILGVGGDEKIGGEKLIEALSYKIYLHNLTDLKKENIPIEKPYGEELPDDLPDRLINPSNYSRSNMNKINEEISRKIFEGKISSENEGGQSRIDCELTDLDGNPKGVELVYDIMDLEGVLEERIKKTVETFAYEMNATLGKIEGYSPSEVNIFRAGNSSRSTFVEECMEKEFAENSEKGKIKLVDEIGDHIQQNQRYAITPKTAVAFGQLKLNNLTVRQKELMFKYYIGYFNLGTGKFKSCINKNDSGTEWKKFRKITSDRVDIYYGESIPTSPNGPHKIIEAEGCRGKYLYIRVVDEVTIEYCICESENDEKTDVKTLKFI